MRQNFCWKTFLVVLLLLIGGWFTAVKGQTYDPATVAVVVNMDDPESSPMAEAYATAWGIPEANIIQINGLGTGRDLTDLRALDAVRNAISTYEVAVLAWMQPSRCRYSGELSNGSKSMSITSAVTFGNYDPFSLRQSELYGYTGTTPRTDRGVTPAYLLVDDAYIRRDAHGTSPAGTSYAVFANDQTNTPRGSARKGQQTADMIVWDNTTGVVGRGDNSCNYLSNNCWVRGRTPVGPVVAAYQSMYKLGDDGGIQWMPGFYGDHVTSFGGYLPGTGSDFKNGAGQTSLEYHLSRGASMSVGSVAEPWQGGDGALDDQFVDIGRFDPLFKGGLSAGIAAYSAVRAPGRMLFAGDPLCAPFLADDCETLCAGWGPCVAGIQLRECPRPGCVTSRPCTSPPPAGDDGLYDSSGNRIGTLEVTGDSVMIRVRLE